MIFTTDCSLEFVNAVRDFPLYSTENPASYWNKSAISAYSEFNFMQKRMESRPGLVAHDRMPT